MTNWTLKIFDFSIWNKKTYFEIEKCKNKWRNEIIAQTTSFVIAMNIEIFLRNESIFETKNVKTKWSSKKIIEKRITNQLSKLNVRSISNYINSSIRRKFAKIKQNATCNVTFFLMRISKNCKIFNKISRIIVLRSRFSFSSYIRLMSLISRCNKNSLKTLKSKYFRSTQTKRKSIIYVLIIFDLSFRNFKLFIHSTMQNHVNENVWNLSKTQNFTYELTTKSWIFRVFEIKFHHKKRTIVLFNEIWTYQ